MTPFIILFIAASKIQHGDFVAVIGLAPACIMAITHRMARIEWVGLKIWYLKSLKISRFIMFSYIYTNGHTL
jgi:hypothetical protein